MIVDDDRYRLLDSIRAYALEAMVDGFLTELYVRRNPYLLALELSEAEIARTLSDAWEGAIARLRGPTGEG